MAIVIILPEMVELGYNIPIKYSALVILIANVILRFLTTGAVAIKDKK